MTDDPHALSGAYALDAIDDVEEQRLFESHLAGCETCTTELREFRATSARLGMAAAEPPPPALRDRVLADIRQIRQFPAPSNAVPEPRRPAPEPSHPRRWRRAVATCLAAAACLVTAASVTQAVREHQRMERADATASAIASILSAPDAHSATGRTKQGGTVTVIASDIRGRAVVASSGLRTLPASKIYQLWLIDPTAGPRPGGLITNQSRPLIMRKWRPADTLGVTIEPVNGSRRPTTPPVVLLKPP